MTSKQRSEFTPRKKRDIIILCNWPNSFEIKQRGDYRRGSVYLCVAIPNAYNICVCPSTPKPVLASVNNGKPVYSVTPPASTRPPLENTSSVIVPSLSSPRNKIARCFHDSLFWAVTLSLKQMLMFIVPRFLFGMAGLPFLSSLDILNILNKMFMSPWFLFGAAGLPFLFLWTKCSSFHDFCLGWMARLRFLFLCTKCSSFPVLYAWTVTNIPARFVLFVVKE